MLFLTIIKNSLSFSSSCVFVSYYNCYDKLIIVINLYTIYSDPRGCFYSTLFILFFFEAFLFVSKPSSFSFSVDYVLFSIFIFYFVKIEKDDF